MTDPINHPALRLPWPVWTAPARDRAADRWRESVDPTLREIREALLHPREFRFDDVGLVRRLTTAMTVITPIQRRDMAGEEDEDGSWIRGFWNSRADPGDRNIVAAWLGQALAVEMGGGLPAEGILESTLTSAVADNLMTEWRSQAWSTITTTPAWCAPLIRRLNDGLMGSFLGYDQLELRPWKELRSDMTLFLQATRRVQNVGEVERGTPLWLSDTDLAANCLAMKALYGIKPRRVTYACAEAVDGLWIQLDSSQLPDAVKQRAQAEWDLAVLTRVTNKAPANMAPNPETDRPQRRMI
jgi:hypothetical protein